MDNQTKLTPQTFLKISEANNIISWVEAFLTDRKTQNLTPQSIRYYRQKLQLFVNYCYSQMIYDITEIDINLLRRFMLYLQESGHNPGGCHSFYRSVKAFLNWYENEIEDYKNPIHRLKSPKVPEKVLPPTPLEDIFAMVSTCKRSKFTDIRDKAIVLCLLDSGARVREFLELNQEDINLITGSILIKRGKSQKSRMIYVGKKSRIAIRRYLKTRDDNNPALWINIHRERLQYDGMKEILKRRAKLANVKPPSCHGIRRATAINLLRNGTNLFVIQRILGHTTLNVIKQYLYLVDNDLNVTSVSDNYLG